MDPVLRRISACRKIVQSLLADQSPCRYVYPTTDRQVDDALLLQDSGKTPREESLVISHITTEGITLEHGAGLGKHLAAILGTPSRGPRYVIGTDLDPNRAKAAHAALTKIAGDDAAVVHGGVDILNLFPAGVMDTVLNIQVLGHCRRNEATQIIMAIHRLLRPGGTLVLCVPVVTGAFKESANESQWTAPNDYYHLVDLNRSPFDQNFRRLLSPDEFDVHASTGGGHLLPVRCFYCEDFPPSASTEMPYNINSIPNSFEKDFASRFEVDRSAVYSVHRLTPTSEKAVIGDLLLVMKKC